MEVGKCLSVEGSDKVLSGCKVGAAVNLSIWIRDTVRVAQEHDLGLCVGWELDNIGLSVI